VPAIVRNFNPTLAAEIAALLNPTIDAVRNEVNAVRHQVDEIRNESVANRDAITALRNELGDVRQQVVAVRHQVDEVRNERVADRDSIIGLRNELGDVRQQIVVISHELTIFCDVIRGNISRIHQDSTSIRIISARSFNFLSKEDRSLKVQYCVLYILHTVSVYTVQ
jgi:predicted  nucleic acid-binding Zn-ribbon protein